MDIVDTFAQLAVESLNTDIAAGEKALAELKLAKGHIEDNIKKQKAQPKELFYPSQEVLVSLYGEFWQNRYFSNRTNTGTFETTQHPDANCERKEYWKFCKPNPNAKSNLVWHKHTTNICPIIPTTNIITQDSMGICEIGKASTFSWKQKDTIIDSWAEFNTPNWQ